MLIQRLLDEDYECKHHWLGLGKDEEQSVRILNRVIRWIHDCIIYEADSRHAEVVINQLQLGEAKPATSFGTREEQFKNYDNVIGEMSGGEASRYRMIVARLNHLSMDRLDIQHATKEATTSMARPQNHHWSIVKRIARYLYNVPSAIQKFLAERNQHCSRT